MYKLLSLFHKSYSVTLSNVTLAYAYMFNKVNKVNKIDKVDKVDKVRDKRCAVPFFF